MPQTATNDNSCVLVIFGATGDLTGRKLMPALYNLARDKQLPPNFACVGFARREKSNEDFRKEMGEDVKRFSRIKPENDDLWNSFSQNLFYHVSDFDNDTGYDKLRQLLADLDAKCGTKGNRVFYLSIPPSYFALVAEKLAKHGLIYNENEVKDKWSRIIIEKPFGHDLDSAIALQKDLSKFLAENQVYRIDHYLGKETVQNLLVFRFANSFFESLWNHRYIDHVQITVAEELGIGTRGLFFEEAGILRDIVQNHMMQLLSLVAMEPPVSLRADSIRDEKVKVLDAVRPVNLDQFDQYVVRGQYGRGKINNEEVVGYREEKNVSPTSSVETFIALQLFIDNWRWFGVPFYLRTGKRLCKRMTEISIHFKDVPDILFQQEEKRIACNVLYMRIQPNEGIGLVIDCKVPGAANLVQAVNMDFRYAEFFNTTPPEAYERLICDCILGDNTLFIRGDEVQASWRLLTPVLKRWAQTPAKDFPNYEAGSWGPKAADEMLRQSKRAWRNL